MAKFIDERIERLGWELEDLNANIEGWVTDLKQELENPTDMSNFACGGGLLDVLLAKRTAKQEELKALQRIAEEERA